MATAVGALLLIGGISEAVAACTESDVAGAWRVVASVTKPDSSYRMECDIEIDGSGDISSGDCIGPDKQSIRMTDGWVKVIGSSCKFTGGFRLNSTANRIERASLNDGGNSAEGEGSFNGGSFSFTMERAL